MNKEFLENLILSIKRNETIRPISDTEYFYILGQILSAIFIKIGGFDMFRKEYNYLTNPYISRSIFELRKRILRFLKNSSLLVNMDNEVFKAIYNLLFIREVGSNSNNIRNIEDAFYEGLYAENIIIEYGLLN